MTWIIGQEGMEVEKEALDIIARVAQGGMRDALSLLDQAIAHSNGKVTLDDVIELTGTVNLRLIGEMTKVLVNRDTAKVLDLLDEILDSGKEGKFLIDDLLSYFRDILVFRRIGDQANLTKAVTDISFKAIAKDLELARVYDVIEQLSKCQHALKFTGNERIAIEVSLMKITSSPTTDDFILLRKEVDQLKKYISENGPLPAVTNSEGVVATTIEIEEKQPVNPTEIKEETNQGSVGHFDILSQVENDLNQKSSEIPFVENDANDDSNEIPIENEVKDDLNEVPSENQKNINTNEILDECKEEFNVGLDLFALMEKDLKDFSNSPEEEISPIQKKEDPSQRDQPLSFLEQVERDMADGAEYIEITTFSDENVPPVLEDDTFENNVENKLTKKEDMEIPKSEKEDKVLDILSYATKALKQEYLEKHEEVLNLLKKERFATMALYRESKVVAINEKFLVVTYPDKAKVQLLEKVINRSIVKSVIEEVTNRTLDIVAVSEAEWDSILAAFLNKR